MSLRVPQAMREWHEAPTFNLRTFQRATENTQRDPAGQGLNWYIYCANNPLKFVDPTGMEISADRYASVALDYLRAVDRVGLGFVGPSILIAAFEKNGKYGNYTINILGVSGSDVRLYDSNTGRSAEAMTSAYIMRRGGRTWVKNNEINIVYNIDAFSQTKDYNLERFVTVIAHELLHALQAASDPLAYGMSLSPGQGKAVIEFEAHLYQTAVGKELWDIDTLGMSPDHLMQYVTETYWTRGSASPNQVATVRIGVVSRRGNSTSPIWQRWWK